MIKISYVILSFVLLISSFSVSAGKIYRFKDQNNQSTLSRILPPYAAQKGYDILNDKTLIIIKRIKSLNEVQNDEFKRKQEHHKVIEEQKKRAAEKQVLAEKKQQDATLLARYPSEDVLIKSHSAEILYIQNRIDRMKSQQAKEIKKLIKLQSKAAEEEINNGKISTNLQSAISLSQQNIYSNRAELNKLTDEKDVVSQYYNAELEHLRSLLK